MIRGSKMRVLPGAFLLMGGFVLPVFSQDQRPSPTPPVENDVVKISTNLIQIDVSVTDSNGKVVTDLKPGEIEIYENGKKQAITNFSFVSTGKLAAAKLPDSAKNTDKVPVPPSPPPVVPRADNIKRT